MRCYDRPPFIKSNVDGLAEGSASSWDVLHLHPKLLDHLHYQCHHVSSVAVEDKEGDNVIWSRCNVWRQHLIDPRYHTHLIHPCIEFPGR